MSDEHQQRKKAAVFISYAREDKDFVRVLRAALEVRGFEPKGDWLLTTGDDFARRLRDFNLEAHAFIFVISPDSIKSEACRNELALAVEHKKQILPISHRDHGDDNLLDSALRAPQWTFLRAGDDFERSMENLVRALNTDFALMDMHQVPPADCRRQLEQQRAQPKLFVEKGRVEKCRGLARHDQRPTR